MKTRQKQNHKTRKTSDTDTDDSNNVDRCPICLCTFRDQETGSPDACEHMFCLECLEEWSKTVNTCPIDRRSYKFIYAKKPNSNAIFKKIMVEDRTLANQQVNDNGHDDVTFCELCGRSDREDRMLLCDGCDLGYHCECLRPPIDEIPFGSWYCPACVDDDNDSSTTTTAMSMNDDALTDAETIGNESDDDALNIGNIVSTALRATTLAYRPIARTRFSERVRRRINTTRLQRGVSIIVSESDTSATEDSDDAPNESTSDIVAPSTSKPTTTRTTRSKTAARRTRRKAPKKRTSRKSQTSRKTNKRRRKTRRKRVGTTRRKRRLVKKSTCGKTRIKFTRPQERIINILSGQQPSQSRDDARQRANAGIPTFNLFSSSYDNEVGECSTTMQIDQAKSSHSSNNIKKTNSVILNSHSSNNNNNYNNSSNNNKNHDNNHHTTTKINKQHSGRSGANDQTTNLLNRILINSNSLLSSWSIEDCQVKNHDHSNTVDSDSDYSKTTTSSHSKRIKKYSNQSSRMSTKADKTVEYDPFDLSDSDTDHPKQETGDHVNDHAVSSSTSPIRDMPEQLEYPSSIKSDDKQVQVKAEDSLREALRKSVDPAKTDVTSIQHGSSTLQERKTSNALDDDKLAQPINSDKAKTTEQTSSRKKKSKSSRSRSHSRSSIKSTSPHRRKSKTHSKKRSRSRSNSKKTGRHTSSSSHANRKRSRSRSKSRRTENRKRSRSRSKTKSHATNGTADGTHAKGPRHETSPISNNHIKNFLQHMKTSQVASRNMSRTKTDAIGSFKSSNVETKSGVCQPPRSNLIEIKVVDETSAQGQIASKSTTKQTTTKSTTGHDTESKKSNKSASDYLIEEMFNEEKQQKIDLNEIKLPECATSSEHAKDKDKLSLDQRLLELFGKKVHVDKSDITVKAEPVNVDAERIGLPVVNVTPAVVPLVQSTRLSANDDGAATATSSAQASMSTNKSHADIDTGTDMDTDEDDDDVPYDPEKEYELDDIKQCEQVKSEANNTNGPSALNEFKAPMGLPKKANKPINKERLKENVIKAAKNSIKPFYLSKKINKNEYKYVMRKVVNKLLKHAKSEDVSDQTVAKLIVGYVDKIKKSKSL